MSKFKTRNTLLCGVPDTILNFLAKQAVIFLSGILKQVPLSTLFEQMYD